MTHEGPRADDIRKGAETLLRAADVKGRLPTPVDDIIAAAGLVEPEHSLLSDSVLAQAPTHLRDKIRKLRLKVRAVLDHDARRSTSIPTSAAGAGCTAPTMIVTQAAGRPGSVHRTLVAWARVLQAAAQPAHGLLVTRLHVPPMRGTDSPQAASSNFPSNIVLGTGSTRFVECLARPTVRGCGR